MRFLSFLLCLTLAPLVGADLSIKFLGVDAGSRPYILDADLDDADPSANRNSFPVTAEVQFSRSAGDPDYDRKYRVVYQLLDVDAGGAPLKLADGEFEGAGELFVMDFSSAGGSDSLVIPVIFRVDPAATLAPDQHVAVGVRLEETSDGGVNWDPVPGVEKEGDSFLVLHFDNREADMPDESLNVMGRVESVSLDGTTRVQNVAGLTTLPVSAAAFLMRYDDISESVVEIDVAYVLDYDLTDDLGNPVPLVDNGIFALSAKVASYDDTNPAPFAPKVVELAHSGSIEPVGQLDPVNRTYTLRVQFRHAIFKEGDPNEADGGEASGNPQRILDLNGTLSFDTIDFTIHDLNNTPAVGLIGAGYVETELLIPLDGAESVTRSGLVVGDGVTTLRVEVIQDGTAIVSDGSLSVYEEGQVVGPISYTYPAPGIQTSSTGITVGPAGGTAGSLQVSFPQGFGLQLDAERFGRSVWTFTNTALNANLLPVNVTDVLPAGTRAYDESLPVTFQANSIGINATNGTLWVDVADPLWIHRTGVEALEAMDVAGKLASADLAIRFSNDGFLRSLSGIQGGGQLTIRRAADGSSRPDIELRLAAGSYRTHFPKDVQIGWNDPSSLVLQDGVVDPSSQLAGSDPVDVAYRATCPPGTGACPAAEELTITHRLKANADLLFLTPSGGLYAGGSEETGNAVEWGLHSVPNAPDLVPAHRADNPGTAEFYAAGFRIFHSENPLVGGPLPAVNVAQLTPVALLLAGYDPNVNTRIFPMSTNYAEGKGVYAGMNFVAETGASGASWLADAVDGYAYTLWDPYAKYYTRASGLSGRHPARTDSLPAEPAVLYGYQMDFSRFQFSLLSSVVKTPTWIDGSIAFDDVSVFTQRFQSLEISCSGSLGSMRMDPTDRDFKNLTYWNGRFRPGGVARFVPQSSNPNDECPTRAFAVGVSSEVAYITDTLYGVLGFQPNGNLVTPADGFGDVHSQLGVPSRVEVEGPSDRFYQISTLSTLRFSNPEADTHASVEVPNTGFVSFAGRVNVPFFKDFQVQAITTANAEGQSFYFTPGFTLGGETFFSSPDFDPDHSGWPAHAGDISYTEFRSPNENTAANYLITAEASIFDLVNVAYPVLFNPGSRYFRGVPQDPENLLVVEIEHHLDYLDPKVAQLNFGIRYDGLPSLNVGNIAVSIVQDQVGAGLAFVQDGVDSALGQVRNSLIDGVDSADKLLSDTMEDFFNQALDAVEDQVLDPMLDAAEAEYDNFNGTLAEYQNKLFSEVEADAGIARTFLEEQNDLGNQTLNRFLRFSLKEKTNFAVEEAEQVLSLAAEIDRALRDIQKAIQSIQGKLYRFEKVLPDGTRIKRYVVRTPQVDPNKTEDVLKVLVEEFDVDNPEIYNGLIYAAEGGERQLVTNLVNNLLRELVDDEIRAVINAALSEATSDLNVQLNALLADANPALDRISETLAEVDALIGAIRDQLREGTGALQEVLDLAVDTAAAVDGEFEGMISAVRGEMNFAFTEIKDAMAVDDTTPVAQMPDLFGEFDREAMKARLRARLRDELLGSNFTRQIRNELHQRIYDIEGQVRVAMDSVFQEMNKAIRIAVADAIGGLNDEINALLGDLGEFGGDMGSAEMSGYAHFVDDSISRLRVDGSFQLKVPEDFNLNAFLLIERFRVEDGFDPKPCLLPGQEALEVTLGAEDVSVGWIAEGMRVNFSTRISMINGNPNGLNGTVRMTGGALDFEGFVLERFGAGIGVGPNSSYLAATAEMSFNAYQVAGGFFFGRTCDIEPLEMVDANVAALIGQPPFSGGYLYGETWLPITEIVLGIPATCLFNISAGLGAGAFYFVEGPTYGGQMLAGLSGEALCLVNVRGEVEMIGVMQDDSLRYSGSAKVSGSAGPCPFCVKLSKQVRMAYQNGTWSLDY
jgi:hypothetical protein